MVRAVVFASVNAGSLLIGAALGSFRQPRRALIASMLAFGAGALIVAVAFELFVPAHYDVGLAKASVGLIVGSAGFVAVDLLL
jgi:zinc transporter, ZIP family